MARNMGNGLSGLAKPGKAVAKTPQNRSYITIEPKVAPKTFTDKNLDPKGAAGDPAEKLVKPTAKPGGSIRPQINATPKMGSAFGQKLSKA